MSEAMHQIRFPNENPAYRDARNVLLEAELGLRRQIETVAALRRALPPGGEIPEDYVFDSDEGPVKLSELFGDKDTLIVYSYMYSLKMEAPCPACTSILDGIDATVQHVLPRVALVAVAKSPMERIRAFASERGWTQLKLLSSETNSYNADYHGEKENGAQMPALNVFTRRDGKIRHFWCTELLFGKADPGQNDRHVDLIWPMWNLFDMTPEGRGENTHPKLNYG